MSYHDIAQQFTQRSRSIPYPEMPKKPERGEMSARDYGRAIGVYEQARDEALKGRDEYRVKGAECDADFKAALAKELGLAGHPKYDVLFRLAWEEGHASGYSEVANYADTFAELLRD